MTKYEWEHELKKNIHRLPSDEIARVLDYYNEMFEDNIERGKSEREIIHEFGNPVDVADKILSEYDGELLPEEGHIASPFNSTPPLSKRPETVERQDFGNATASCDVKSDAVSVDTNAKSDVAEQKSDKPNECQKTDETNNRNGRVAFFLVFNIITGFAFVIVAMVLWVVLAAFTVAGVGMGIGGAYTMIVSLVTMFSGAFGSGLAQLGIGIALVGLGMLFVVCCIKLIRIYAKVTKKIFNGIFKVGKKERA